MPDAILVTGGSGFLGRCVVKKLLERYPSSVRTLSRDGNTIQDLLTTCPNKRLTAIVGDIRDKESVNYALKGVDTVIHLAALKHIDLCEMYPIEAIRTNINGTRNLLDAFKGHTFIAMSTDKASEVTNCYGATKMLMERIVLYQAKVWPERRYMVVRSGNLFGSTGSVIERWRRQIREYNRIDVTNPSMTRFFVSASSVADYIINVMENGKSGCVSIPEQKSLRLSDLVGATIDLWGDSETATRIIGTRLGEKEHETLYSAGEDVSPVVRQSCEAERWTLDEIKKELEAVGK